MNEVDVREIIVRPLLHRLGYLHGTDATIRTEVPLKYGYSFLGRKKPGRDAEIRGKADYICDVVSHGRLTVEVKAPNEPVDGSAVEQAHTYAAHPEISADIFMVTNGVRTLVYRTGKLEAPLLDISFDELENRFLELKNIAGVEAIKRHTKALKFKVGKPLGDQLGPEVSIIGGSVTYEEHFAGHPLLDENGIDGLQLPVTGGHVSRDANGMLTASIAVAKALPMMEELNRMIGHDEYIFRSSDEYFSTDPENPTILQNFLDEGAPKGTMMRMPGFGAIPMPYRLEFRAWTEATGFVEGSIFKGTMTLDYDMGFYDMDQAVARFIAAQYGELTERVRFSGTGSFEVYLSE